MVPELTDSEDWWKNGRSSSDLRGQTKQTVAVMSRFMVVHLLGFSNLNYLLFILPQTYRFIDGAGRRFAGFHLSRLHFAVPQHASANRAVKEKRAVLGLYSH